MSTDAEFDILATKGDHLAIPEPRLHSDQQQRPVPSSDPCIRIGRCHKSCAFLLRQERYRCTLKTLRWYRQDALAVQRQRWLADSYVSEERV
jgi:hypothetical protein